MNGMTYLQATLLGALQGLTEFLPISSSGHLVLLQHIFGLHEPALIFDLFLHIATLAAVLTMYRQDVYALFTAWFSPRNGMPGNDPERASARRLGLLLVLANIPTAAIGLLFESTFEQLFSAPWIVGMALLVTGALLWLLRPSSGRRGGHRKWAWRMPSCSAVSKGSPLPLVSHALAAPLPLPCCVAYRVNRQPGFRF